MMNPNDKYESEETKQEETKTTAAEGQAANGSTSYSWQAPGANPNPNPNPNPQQPYQQSPYSWGQQSNPNPTYWQGSTYHSAYQPQTPPVYTVKPIKEKRNGKGRKTFLKVTAGVLACLMISFGSVAGFTALVNNGYVTLKGTSSAPMFSVTQNTTKAAATSTSSTASGQLTMQEIAKKVVPSVVCIQNYQVTQQYGWRMSGTNGTNGTNGTADNSSGVSPAGEGSGIIATADGYIITNAHVVEGATSLKVITSDGKTYEAKLIGSDSVTDLAVVKIDATGLTAAEFGDSSQLQVADAVMAIGNPGGMEFNSSVTIGYVSALNRVVGTDSSMKYIQTDAAINPGNSGGALVNMYGQVVGINSAKISDVSYEGLGFSIPINTAQPVVSDLKAYGYVKDRAALGISGQFIDSMTARFYGLPTGMSISKIASDNVKTAGLQEGDVITAIDGKEVSSSSVVTAAVTAKKPGDTVTLKVYRPTTGSSFTATVKLSESTGS